MGTKLKDRVALITGGGRGIGRAIAEAYAGEGCRLALCARSQDELESAAEAICKANGTTVRTYQLDVSVEPAVHAVVASVLRDFGTLDVLVNNAGVVGPMGPLDTIDTEAWWKTVRINLGGTFYCIKAVLPHMRKRNYGRIVNLSGGGVFVPAPFMDAYAMTKIAVVRLTENLAQELQGTGIAVSALAPGGVNTRMFDEMLAAGEENVGAELWKSFLERQKKGGDSVESAAGMAVLLATEEAAAVNGRLIGAKWDSWPTLMEHRHEVAASDVYTLRRILPKDRGFLW